MSVVSMQIYHISYFVFFLKMLSVNMLHCLVMVTASFLLNALLVGCAGVITALLFQFSLSTLRYRLFSKELEEITRLEDTPTVSLCIPARNENYALADCLTSALTSDYPKLEVIVLDDCSQDKTSQIIRSFAQDGVRFVSGDTPSDDWLGKNNAYEALAHEARGTYLVFMSVDTRLNPDSISQLVAYMQLEKLSMVSVLPRRIDNFRTSVVFAPLRYFWQVVLPLRFNTPLATSLWVIRQDALNASGGFEKYKDRIDIENVLAAIFVKREEYRFLIANGLLSVSYAKKWSSQVETATRTWYPTLNKNYFLALVTIFLHVVLFVLPSAVLVGAILAINSTNGYIQASWLLALVTWALGSYLYFAYFRRVQVTKSLADYLVVGLSFFLVPLLALQEISLIVASFVAYKRGKVDWKGRNICYSKAR